MDAEPFRYQADSVPSDPELWVDTPSQPFIHPADQDLSCCCYTLAGLLCFQRRFAVLGGQVLRFCNPSQDWINRELDFRLTSLLSRVRTIPRSNAPALCRAEIICSGEASFGNTSLHSESCIYRYHPDSIMGFDGCSVDRVWPVHREDVEAMVTADSYDGGLSGGRSVFPKFFVVDEESDDAQARYCIEEEKWLSLVETDAVRFTPNAERNTMYQQFDEMARDLGHLQRSGATVYIGTDTFLTASGTLNPDHRELELVHDISQGMDALFAAGIKPGLVRVPRTPGPPEVRHAGFWKTLNSSARSV